MWQMIAEPGLRCAECRHIIAPGRLCLSELPEETPAGVSRSDFRNYCIGCPQCWAQGKHACYIRRLNSGGSVGKTPRSLPCARCGRRIGAGEKAGVDVYYEWPDATEKRAHTATSLNSQRLGRKRWRITCDHQSVSGRDGCFQAATGSVAGKSCP